MQFEDKDRNTLSRVQPRSTTGQASVNHTSAVVNEVGAALWRRLTMANVLNQQPRWETIDKSDMTLKTAMEEYLTACRTEGKTVKTLSDYRQKLSRFVEWRGGSIGGLTLASARRFVAHLQETPKWSTHSTIETSSQMLSAQTVAGHVRALKGFSTWLHEEEYIADNVLRRLAKPKVPFRVVEVLTDEEVKKLFQVLDPNTGVGARDAAILTVFLDSGLRLSELVGLRVQDVHIPQAWLKVDGKGDKERIVPFGARATKVFNRYATFFRPKDLDTDAFFVNVDGGPITENTHDDARLQAQRHDHALRRAQRCHRRGPR